MPQLKRESDEHAYEFLVGFLGTSGLDSQTLYSSVDNKGAMLAGPID